MLASLLVALLVAPVASLADAATPPVRFIEAPAVDALRAEDAALLDARSPSEFAAGHLAGAVSCPLALVGGFGRAPLDEAGAARLAERFAALGVDGARAVVVYGGGREGSGEEGRVAWLLVALGHARVRILDGGVPRWVATRRALVTTSTTPAPGRFHARTGAARLRAVASDYAGALVVDTRSDDEWALGHVPGARHLDWRRFFDDDGHPLAAAALAARLGIDHRLLDGRRRLVVYCSGGVRAALAWAVLAQAGVGGVALDDASFDAWRASGRPVTVEK